MTKPPLAVMILSAVVLGTTTAERSAAAQVWEEPTDVEQRLGFDLGLASAVGSAGLTYQIAPVPWLIVEGGLGYGATGAQVSVMPKVALGQSTCRFLGGVGASLGVGGAHAESGHGPSPGAIPWLNFDVLGGECRASNALSIQAALGLTVPLATFHYDVAGVGDTTRAGEAFPQGRLGVGWWF